MQAYEDFLLNAYRWLTLGLLFRLPTIALSSSFAAATSPERPRASSRNAGESSQVTQLWVGVK
jgi:hypothetical protein